SIHAARDGEVATRDPEPANRTHGNQNPREPEPPDPGSRIPDPGSRIPDPGSRSRITVLRLQIPRCRTSRSSQAGTVFQIAGTSERAFRQRGRVRTLE